MNAKACITHHNAPRIHVTLSRPSLLDQPPPPPLSALDLRKYGRMLFEPENRTVTSALPHMMRAVTIHWLQTRLSLAHAHTHPVISVLICTNKYLCVSFGSRFVIDVKGVEIFHQKLSRPHKAVARSQFLSEIVMRQQKCIATHKHTQGQ